MDELLTRIRKFRDDRDWMQFHDPKNLAISIVIESAELLEQFQWKNAQEVNKHCVQNREAISDEIADVAIYLFELADNLGIDLFGAIHKKLDKNGEKYPVHKAKGIARKYTDL